MIRSSYSSSEACAAAGVTYRMLDYWTRSDKIAPSIVEGDGSGSRREWSRLDVARLAAIGEVVADLGRLGVDMSVELVEMLWERLREYPDTVICEGTLTLSASRAPVT